MKTDNELIAEFMEYKFPNNQPIDLGRAFWLYHASWDWIMPVVEKINSNGVSINIAFLPISKNIECSMYSPNPVWSNDEEESGIEAIYKMVVNYIKWYNSINGTK